MTPWLTRGKRVGRVPAEMDLILARQKIIRALAEQGYRAGQVSPRMITLMAKRLLKTQEKEEEE